MINIKAILSLIVTSTPSEVARKFLLNLIPGFAIEKKCKIGLFNFLNLDKLDIENSKIGNFNIIKAKKLKVFNSKLGNFNSFYNFREIILIKDSIIGSNNLIKEKTKYNKIFFMSKAQISYTKKFFLNGGLYLGPNVVFGGIGSRIISSDNTHKTIFFGNTFIGSGAIFCSGVKIGKNVTIGARTVIGRKNLCLAGKYFSKKLILIENN